MTTSQSPLDLKRGLFVLLDPQIRKVAIANPEHAPYGRAAVAALRREKRPRFLQVCAGRKYFADCDIRRLRRRSRDCGALPGSGASDAGEGKIRGRSWGKNIRPSNKLL